MELRKATQARRRGRGLSAVAATAVVVVATAVWLNGNDNRARWTTSVVPQSPLAARIRPALVWIDDELLVWGGDDDYVTRTAQEQDRQTFFDDGAIYRPESRRWIPMPVSPFRPSQSPPKAIAAGGSAVVWRGSELAVFDMTAMTWGLHLVFSPHIVAVAWTGTELLVVGPDVAVDLDASAQRNIAKAPASFVRPDAIWTDAGLVIVGRTKAERCVAFILDQAGVWRSITPPEFSNQYVAATRLGSKVFVVLSDSTKIETLEFAPTTNTWTHVAAPETPPAIWLPTVAATRSDVVLLKTGRAYIRSNGGNWVLADPLPGIPVVAAGDDGAFWLAGMNESQTALTLANIHR